MSPDLPLITLHSCPKGYSQDVDKALHPRQTLANVKARLDAFGADIYAGSRRVDTGRLGIPVYIGICGQAARAVMPTRKQMGKGSTSEQAQASALMEVMERFAFFSFWHREEFWQTATWSEARKRFGTALAPVEQILASVKDRLAPGLAEELLDLRAWRFYPATDLQGGRICWLPLDWFRLLGEFNGSSAGNTPEESLLQGICELVERHACALVDRQRPTVPTIDLTRLEDPTLARLVATFQANGIHLLVKDFSMGMPLPTIGALAWDPATFPEKSEIVFTAGTATSPTRAAIRALTEVAQLGGDFHTASCYEASGLPKFSAIAETDWLRPGPLVPLGRLADISHPDMAVELGTLLGKLAPLRVYAIDATHPELGIPAHYSICPGLEFRERDTNQSLGLFLGRKLAEEAPPAQARHGLAKIGQYYPDAHFLPFFHGLIALREESPAQALDFFIQARPLQPDADSKGLVCFYAGYAQTLMQNWRQALAYLMEAHAASPQLKEACNLLGVAHFKLKNFREAEQWFDAALAIDKGSAVDLANRGLARKFQGHKDAALHDLQAALKLEPGLDFAAAHLAELMHN